MYVTCMCVPEDVPDVPGMEVHEGGRPDMRGLVRGIMGGGGGGGGDQGDGEGEGEGEGKEREKDVDVEGGERKCNFEGSLGMCASGPASLVVEASNAVARFAGTRLGNRVGLHTEVFAV